MAELVPVGVLRTMMSRSAGDVYCDAKAKPSTITTDWKIAVEYRGKYGVFKTANHNGFINEMIVVSPQPAERFTQVGPG
ncbi:hypothetical protein ACU4GD_44160 [Cupriavidus basilensis]